MWLATESIIQALCLFSGGIFYYKEILYVDFKSSELCYHYK